MPELGALQIFRWASVNKNLYSSQTPALNMASLIRFLNGPQCIFCLKRITNSDITFHILPFHRQVRGKKKLGKAAAGMVNVQLLQDVPGYGPKGSKALRVVIWGNADDARLCGPRSTWSHAKYILSAQDRSICDPRSFTRLEKERGSNGTWLHFRHEKFGRQEF